MAYELRRTPKRTASVSEKMIELEEKIELLQNSERIYENLAGAYTKSHPKMKMLSRLFCDQTHVGHADWKSGPLCPGAGSDLSSTHQLSFTMSWKTYASFRAETAATPRYFLQKSWMTAIERSDLLNKVKKQARQIHRRT